MRTLLVAALLALPTAALAADSDGDGVQDPSDVFPCDGTRAATAFSPGEGQFAALLFEDQWPNLGDADFNDAVVAFHYVVVTDAAGDVKDIVGDFHLVARGAAFDHAFGVHLAGLPGDASGSVSIERIESGDTSGVVSSRTVADVIAVQLALRRGSERSGSSIMPVLHSLTTREAPPTFNRTNKFTNGFQTLVDPYGVANYREMNPGGWRSRGTGAGGGWRVVVGVWAVGF